MEQTTEEYNYYTLLGIDSSASPEQIKTAYRTRAQECHPDLSKENADIALFIAIKKAYDILIDPEKRNEYNKEKGFSYNEEVSIGGASFVEPQDEEQSGKVELSPDRISTAKVFSSISADPSATTETSGLRVDQKAAMELEQSGDSTVLTEQVQGAWGEEEPEPEEETEEAPKGKFFNFSKKVSSLVKQNKDKNKRKKLKETLKERFSEEPDRTQFTSKLQKPKNPRARKKSDHFTNAKLSAVRGQRIFEFRVSKLEALVGAKRSLASQSRDGEPIIREVNIPPGVFDGQVLEVSWGWKSEMIKVNIDFDPLWDVRGMDIFLKLPITIEEYFEGCELAIPCFGGQARVKISKEIDLSQPVKIQGKGVMSKKESGDLYVMPFVTPPKEDSEMISTMLEYVDKAYTNDVRSKLLELISNPAWYWSDEKGDYLHVPITFVEAYKGGKVTIDLEGEKVEVEIPKFCSANDVVEVKFGENSLFVMPIVLLPENLEDVNLLNASKGLAQHYNFPVRKNLPKKFSA